MTKCSCGRSLLVGATICEACYAVEAHLEQYLGSSKGRAFVRETLVRVSLALKSRGERENLEQVLRERWQERQRAVFK